MTPDSLPREIAPPSTLEDRTAQRLRTAGLLRPAPGGRRRLWMQAAAALLLFAGGAATGAAWTRTAPMAVGQPRFLFLLDGVISPTAADERRAVEDYRSWAARLRVEGRYVTGERLRGDVGVVPDQAAPAGRELQGYFVISASHLDDALSVARSSPHAQRGGRVVVRPIDTP